MYAYIKGTLEELNTGTGTIVVEAAGVGYEINVPSSVLPSLPGLGAEVKIHTYFSVKEDGQSLFGFLTREDREMFIQLISVNGIGPKGALGILSVLKPSDLRMAIMTGDAKSISQAPGIGKKTAERVILDLRDKLSKEAGYSDPTAIIFESAGAAFPMGEGPVAEAIDALTMLGYSRMEAGRAVGAVPLQEGMTTEELLKAALKAIR